MDLLQLTSRRRGRSDGRTNSEQSGTPAPGRIELAVTSRPLARNDELRLADEPAPDPARHRSPTGFDPYSSDGGFAKPHAWERTERD